MQTTWAKVSPHADQLAALFDDRLFEIAPEVKSMLKGDMLEQGRKLMTMIRSTSRSTACRTSKRPPPPHRPRLRGLPLRLGWRRALLWTPDPGLADAYTPDVAAAGSETYAKLAKAMKNAASRAA